MNLTRPIALSIVAGAIALVGVPAQNNPANLVTVKYDGLKREVLKHRGKVVVVDFWASY